MRFNLALAVGLTLLVPVGAALAIPITSVSQLVIFGDSLSDPGNASIATLGAFPGSNYATRNIAGLPFSPGYYTDGSNTNPPVPAGGPTGLWIDQFATKAGLSDPQPSLPPSGGTNYAFASAETGSNGLFYVSDQVNQFSLTHGGAASPTALYAIWGGANDIFDGKNPIAAADNLYGNILTLHAEGAQYFLWPNLPPLGNTPFGYTNSLVGPLDLLSNEFDTEWSIDLAKLQSQNIQVVGVDVNTLFDQIAANPLNYGFSNITGSAQGMTGVNPDTYLFWDDVHPTTAGDALIANLAFNDFVAAPEPESFALALAGFCALLAFVKIRRHIATKPSRAREQAVSVSGC